MKSQNSTNSQSNPMGYFDSANVMAAIDMATRKSDLTKPGREQWVPDEDVVACCLCKRDFNMFTRRRHHCRMCGKVFCHSCSNYKIAIQRSHYAADEEKEHRVCKTCYDKKMKELDGYTPVCLHDVEVTGVDHDGATFAADGSINTGKKFFFEPDTWSAMINADSSASWDGKKQHVIQKRDDTVIWRGYVTLKRCGPDGTGEKTAGRAYGDWQMGDIVQVVGTSNPMIWKEKDAKLLNWQEVNAEEDKEELGGQLIQAMPDRVDMFTGLREIAAVDLAAALERLNPEPKASSSTPCCCAFFAAKEPSKPRLPSSEKVNCDEGVCIVICKRPGSEHRRSYLLIREDQKKQGDRMYEEYISHEKARWAKHKARLKHRVSQ